MEARACASRKFVSFCVLLAFVFFPSFGCDLILVKQARRGAWLTGCHRSTPAAKNLLTRHPLTRHVCAIQFDHNAHRTLNALGLGQIQDQAWFTSLFVHLKSLVIWCVTCLIHGCSLTRLTPWALPLLPTYPTTPREHSVHPAHLQDPSVDKMRPQESLWREDLQSGGNPRTTTLTGLWAHRVCDCLKDRSIFWRSTSIIWCTCAGEGLIECAAKCPMRALFSWALNQIDDGSSVLMIIIWCTCTCTVYVTKAGSNWGKTTDFTTNCRLTSATVMANFWLVNHEITALRPVWDWSAALRTTILDATGRFHQNSLHIVLSVPVLVRERLCSLASFSFLTLAERLGHDAVPALFATIAAASHTTHTGATRVLAQVLLLSEIARQTCDVSLDSDTNAPANGLSIASFSFLGAWTPAGCSPDKNFFEHGRISSSSVCLDVVKRHTFNQDWLMSASPRRRTLPSSSAPFRWRRRSATRLVVSHPTLPTMTMPTSIHFQLFLCLSTVAKLTMIVWSQICAGLALYRNQFCSNESTNSVIFNFFWGQMVGVVFVRKVINLATHFFGSTVVNHVLAELFVSYESVVDSQVELLFCTSSWANWRCSTLCPLASSRNGARGVALSSCSNQE